MKHFADAIEVFTHVLSLKNDVKEAYKYRAECYRSLAKKSRSKVKIAMYNTSAEADEKKYAELNNSNSTKS